jgi:hypothetical protein
MILQESKFKSIEPESGIFSIPIEDLERLRKRRAVVIGIAKEILKGGPGSGFFGHKGRPGHWGGSIPTGGPSLNSLRKLALEVENSKGDPEKVSAYNELLRKRFNETGNLYRGVMAWFSGRGSAYISKILKEDKIPANKAGVVCLSVDPSVGGIYGHVTMVLDKEHVLKNAKNVAPIEYLNNEQLKVPGISYGSLEKGMQYSWKWVKEAEVRSSEIAGAKRAIKEMWITYHDHGNIKTATRDLKLAQKKYPMFKWRLKKKWSL